VHELVDIEHRGVSIIRREGIVTNGGATQSGTEKAIKMREEGILVRDSVVRWGIVFQWIRTSTIEKVDSGSIVVAIRTRELTIEIGQEVDVIAIKGSVGVEDTRDSVLVGSGVVADDSSVDDFDEQCILIFSSVVLLDVCLLKYYVSLFAASS